MVWILLLTIFFAPKSQGLNHQGLNVLQCSLNVFFPAGSDSEEIHYKYHLTVIHGKSEYSYKGPVISLMKSANEVRAFLRPMRWELSYDQCGESFHTTDEVRAFIWPMRWDLSYDQWGESFHMTNGVRAFIRPMGWELSYDQWSALAQTNPWHIAWPDCHLPPLLLGHYFI